jgi:hypothetical protein
MLGTCQEIDLIPLVAIIPVASLHPAHKMPRQPDQSGQQPDNAANRDDDHGGTAAAADSPSEHNDSGANDYDRLLGDNLSGSDCNDDVAWDTQAAQVWVAAQEGRTNDQTALLQGEASQTANAEENFPPLSLYAAACNDHAGAVHVYSCW